jgi:DNA-binding NarL/FixJ family response regulator
LVSLGYHNRQIAQELYISEATVKTQLKSIYSKLAVNNRVAAVVQALRCGIVS